MNLKKHSATKDLSFADDAVELVNSGEDFFVRLLKIISETKNELHLQTYIFEDDATGKEVADALIEAAKRNVSVYVLLDSYGSLSIPKKFVDNLRYYGIHIRFFSPLLSSNNLYIGRRLHHKIVVADACVALVGGINVADKYRGNTATIAWLDYALEIHNQQVASSLQLLCMASFQKKRQTKKSNTTNYLVQGGSLHILQNDWLKQKNEISRAYLEAFKSAKKEIVIVGSYFLPGIRMTHAIKKAANRGVKVTLILSGVSDIPFAQRATNYLYTSLLRNKIKLYEWKKSVLHGKVAMVDNAWATVGSFNLNNLSSYGSIELNIGINSEEFSTKLAAALAEVMLQCDTITTKTLKLRNGLFTNFINWFAYNITRIALIIATYIPRKRLKKLY